MTRMLRCIVLGVVIVFAAGAGAAPLADETVRAEIAKVYNWGGYQRELPGEKPVTEKPRPARAIEMPTDLGSLVSSLLIGLVVVGVAIVALRLLSGEWGLLPRPADAPPLEEIPAATRRQQVRARLDAADRTAVAGDWARAIHILLLTSIDLLHRRLGQTVPDAMTARELVGEAHLPVASREDFAALVAAAELCHFGGRSADRPLYDRCRGHYERLWGVPPEAVA